MVDILAGFDYDRIKEKIKSLCESKDFKVVIIDSTGNVVSDISLSTLIDALRGTDNRTLTDLFNKAYDSTNDRQKISIENDAVGLAKEDTLSAIKNALDSVGTDKIRASIVDTLPESPFIITKIAGTALTGRDWSSDFEKLQNLDVLLSTRAPKDEGETIEICKDADISGGVIAPLKNFKRWTLYLKVADAIDITIELSPDGGNTWFTVPESPVSFSGAGDDIIEFGYDATHVKLTGSNTNAVTAIIRGVF